MLFLALTAGSNFINYDGTLALEKATKIDARLNKIDVMSYQYSIQNENGFNNTSEFIAFIKNEFRRNEASLSDVNVFQNNFLFDESHPIKSTVGNYQVEICFGTDSNQLSQQITEDYFSGIEVLKNQYLSSNNNIDNLSLNYNDFCGATVDKKPDSFPSKLWITYRIK